MLTLTSYTTIASPKGWRRTICNVLRKQGKLRLGSGEGEVLDWRKTCGTKRKAGFLANFLSSLLVFLIPETITKKLC